MITRGLLTQDLDYVLEQTRNELLGLRDKKILVTGASGLLGFWFTAVLLEANSRFNLNLQITITSRLELNLRDFEFYRPSDPIDTRVIDLFDQPNLLFKKKIHFDIIFHSAISDNNNFNITNLKKDLDFIKIFTNQSMITCDSFFFPSSGAVYGQQPLDLSTIPEIFESNLIVGPVTQYGEFKLSAEDLLNEYAAVHKISVVSPRIFTLYGPKLPLDKQFAIGNFVDMARKGLQIELSGNPNTKRSYLYLSDFVVWTIKAIDLKVTQSFHIGSDEIITLSELAKTVSKKFESEYVPKVLKKYPLASNYIPSTTQSRSLLGIDSQIPFSDGLNRWILWLNELV